MELNSVVNSVVNSRVLWNRFIDILLKVANWCIFVNYVLNSRSHKQFKVNLLPTRGTLNKHALLFEIQDKFSTDTSFLKLKKESSLY